MVPPGPSQGPAPDATPTSRPDWVNVGEVQPLDSIQDRLPGDRVAVGAGPCDGPGGTMNGPGYGLMRPYLNSIAAEGVRYWVHLSDGCGSYLHRIGPD